MFPKNRKHLNSLFTKEVRTQSNVNDRYFRFLCYEYSYHSPAFQLWQGQKDSNPRHAVLETAALPAELYPFILLPRSPGALLLYQKTVCLSTSIFDFFAIFSVLLSGQKVVCLMVKNEPFRQIPKGLYHGAAKQI